MIEFDAKTHKYFNNGKELISVTTLMRKHGLAPDYSGVRSDILQAKAERGTLIHQEIEDYIKNGVAGFTNECAAFAAYINNRGLKVLASEKRVYNDICAGTVDLILETADGVPIIADIKTTASLHREAVSWQVSIYDALNGYIAECAQVFRFNKDGELNVVNVPLKTHGEIEALFEAERNGVIYKPRNELSTIDESGLIALAEFERIIADAEARKKEAEAERDKIKSSLLAQMEQNGVKTFETNKIRLTYVAPSTRSTIDTARLKKELPEIAEQYAKTSETKASLKITIKEDQK